MSNRDSGVFHLFPVPSTVEQSANTIKYVCQIPFEDFDASTDNPDFPQEWYDALTYGLATRLAPEYGVPATDRKMLWQEMTIIKQDALNFGLEEGSLVNNFDCVICGLCCSRHWENKEITIRILWIIVNLNWITRTSLIPQHVVFLFC